MAIESILVIHADDEQREALVRELVGTGRETTATADLTHAEDMLATSLFDALFLDASLLMRSGKRTAADIRAIVPDMPIVVTSVENTPAVFALILKLSAEELLAVPTDSERVGALLDRLDYQSRLLDENRYLWAELARVYGYDELVGADPAMAEVLRQATMAAQSDQAVLIQGEQGTEKELVAQYIHRGSDRKAGPFIRMCCKGIGPEHCARELFGWEDAEGRHPGRIDLAADGTLHIDEITALPLAQQARLLALLEENHFQREGGSRAIAGRARVIASTSCDPYEKMRAGELREDLFFRLNVVPIFVPPLRKRPGDLRPLADRFARKFGAAQDAGRVLEPGQWRRMQEYQWPGNVSELEGEMRLAVLRAGETPETGALRMPPEWGDDIDEA